MEATVSFEVINLLELCCIKRFLLIQSNTFHWESTGKRSSRTDTMAKQKRQPVGPSIGTE